MKVVCNEIKDVSYHKECKVDVYCCKKMKKALNITYEKEQWSYDYPHRSFGFDGCGIYVHLLSSEYARGHNIVIDYCPWCGEEFEKSS